ncbi:hypothetical protein [Desulfospira joergensenii]|uniref:hypothetical protein n=1 Tax=Desulfospira joergensenii TaxID=53329 RepID=UPI0004029291|nr:hypothetical protein [Desulfospira joergensenii]
MKRAWPRIIGIGLFHCFLYMYLVPRVIYPRFGENGFIFAAITALVVSVAVLGTLWLNKKTQKNK